MRLLPSNPTCFYPSYIIKNKNNGFLFFCTHKCKWENNVVDMTKIIKKCFVGDCWRLLSPTNLKHIQFKHKAFWFSLLYISCVLLKILFVNKVLFISARLTFQPKEKYWERNCIMLQSWAWTINSNLFKCQQKLRWSSNKCVAIFTRN